MTWFRWALALLVITVSAQAARAEPGAGVRARLAQSDVLRGGFEQEKHLKGFRNPLLSSGDFLLARNRGVLWTTRRPFASTLVLTASGVLVRQPDGSSRSLLNAQSPASMMINSLLMALLSADVQVLARDFRLSEALAGDGSWQLTLQPKAGPLKKMFASIVLGGDRQVATVRLQESRGDTTEIRFNPQDASDAPLTPAEAKQFD